MRACAWCQTEEPASDVDWDRDQREYLCAEHRDERRAIDEPRTATPSSPTRPIGRSKGRGKPTIPAPPLGADRQELLDWLTRVLALPVPLARVARWGNGPQSPMSLVLADGRVINVEEAADLQRGDRIAAAVTVALGEDAPDVDMPGRNEAQRIFVVAVRAAGAVARDDERDETGEWGRRISRVSEERHWGHYTDAPNRWEAMRWLDSYELVDPRAQYFAAYRVPVLVWADGSRWFRTEDLIGFVRGIVGERQAASKITARFEKYGWKHRPHAESRRPSAGANRRGPEDRVRMSIFEVPAESSGAVGGPEAEVSRTFLERIPRPRDRPRAEESPGVPGTPSEAPSTKRHKGPRDTSAPRDTCELKPEPESGVCAGDDVPLLIDLLGGDEDVVVECLRQQFDATEVAA